MPFPEFDPVKKKVLFFTRGRGRGHAIPDLEIARALAAERSDVEFRFVSYAAGAATLAEFGVPLIDVRLPESGATAEMSAIAGRLIGLLNPDLVVSHEEFAAAPAAKIFDKPVVFITDWFEDADQYSMHALKFADRVLFVGRPHMFQEPSWLEGKVQYVGPVLRRFSRGPGDKCRARREIGIEENAVVVAVFPGSWTEAQAPLLQTVAVVFDRLPYQTKHLIWLAGSDFELIRSHLALRPDAIVIDQSWEIDQLMVAADAAITKSNRKTVFELHALGIPTIAVSFGLNAIDDLAIAGLDGVIQADRHDIETALLDVLANRREYRRDLTFASGEDCARYLSAALDAVRTGVTTSP